MSKSRRKIKHIVFGSKLYLQYLHKRFYKDYGKNKVRCRFKNINKEFESGNYYKKISFYKYLI